MKKLIILFLFAQIAFSQTEIAHWNASSAVTSGSNVTSIPDTSGNGYALNAVGSPQYVASGINGLPSVQFTGTNYLELTSSMSQRTNLNELYIVTVFKETDANATNYHNILMVGATSHTAAGSNFMQLYNTNASGVFTANYYNNSLDATYTDTQLDAHYAIILKNATTSTMIFDGGVPIVKTSTQTVNANRLSIGGWNGKNAKMLWSETIVYQNEPTTTELAALNDYLQTTYNIRPYIEVTNNGVAGSTTAGVISRLSTINAQHFDLVYLMIGTNDYRIADETQRLTPAQYKANLIIIVQSLKANGSAVVLMPILPTVDSKSTAVCGYYGQPSSCDSDALAEPFVTAMAEVAQEESVYFLNARARFFADCLAKDNACSAFNTDGFHLNAAGCVELATDMAKFYKAANFNFVNVDCEGDSNFANLYLPSTQTVPAQLKIQLNQ